MQMYVLVMKYEHSPDGWPVGVFSTKEKAEEVGASYKKLLNWDTEIVDFNVDEGTNDHS